MTPTDNILDLAKLKEMMRAIPLAPQMFSTHLLTGKRAYQRGERNYVSFEALHAFKELPARETSLAGAPIGFGSVEIRNAEDIVRAELFFDPFDVQIDIFAKAKPSKLAQDVFRDLISIAKAEYGEKMGEALQAAFYRPPEKKETEDK